MSYEDRYFAQSDYNSEIRGEGHDEGFCEGFARAKELIEDYIRDNTELDYKGKDIINPYQLIGFIQELEGE